jgi:hypothetical protein
MATIQVRDVPDDVAEVIAEKARAENKSVSAYLRGLMADTAAGELRQRAMRKWLGDLGALQTELGLPTGRTVSSVELVREAREAYERDDA